MGKCWLIAMWFVFGVANAADTAREIEVAKVLAIDNATRTWTPGTVLSRTDSKVSAEVAGLVEWVADPGTRVSSGDPIARLADELLSIAVVDQEARVRGLEQRLEFLESEAQRLASLAEVNSAAQSQLEESIANRNVARETITQARAGLRRNRYLLRQSNIAAPFTGQIVERLVDPGEYVAVGQPVARLVDLIDLEVRTQAPLRVAPFVRVGQVLTIKTEEQEHPATVTAVIPVGNLESRSFEIRMVWQGNMVIGTPVRVGLPTSSSKAILTVPRDAMVLRESGSVVFKIAAGKAKRVEIKTGIGAGDRIEVKSGELAANDLVVVSGVEFLREGQAVSFSQPD